MLKFILINLGLLLCLLTMRVDSLKIPQEQDHYYGIRNTMKAKPKYFLSPEDILGSDITPEEEKEPQFWHDIAQAEIGKKLQRQNLNTNKAKNIIYFLGDGMSLGTLTAARMLKGQRKGNNGEEDSLSFEKFPYTGLSKTYCTDSQIADSACSATAYLCGVKANIMTIGVNAKVQYNNCTASMDASNHVSSIAAWAQRAGKSTGFITTTKLTHASPAGTYAHVPNRNFESDADVIKNGSPGSDPAQCMDIARQLVTQAPGSNFNVMMGGGMSKFLPNTMLDSHGQLGTRQDGRNLLSQWQAMHPRGRIITKRSDLLSLNTSQVSNIMGVFNSEYMDFHLNADNAKQPSLAEMTKVALDLLQQNSEGYFVFIEGGLIDVGHHATKAALALDETLEFEKAIEMARAMTNAEDTLIVVTADHGHPLTISGFSTRGAEILGLSEFGYDANGIQYTTLNYPIGPQQYTDENGKRLVLNAAEISNHNFEYPAFYKFSDGTHSGDDVGIYASGPFDHLFTGVMEQSSIPHLMAYAACIGDGQTMCQSD